MKSNYTLALVILMTVTSTASASLVGRDMFYRFPGESRKDAERKAGQPVPGTRVKTEQPRVLSAEERAEQASQESRMQQAESTTIYGYLRSGFGGLLIEGIQGVVNIKITSETRGARGLINRFVEATGTLQNNNFVVTSLEPAERKSQSAREEVKQEQAEESQKGSRVKGVLSVLKSKRANQPNIYFLKLADGNNVQVDISSKVDVDNLIGKEIEAKIKVREDGSWKIRSGAATCKATSGRGR